MTNKKAFQILQESRPVIVAVLRRDAGRFKHAEQLAKSTVSKDDPAELVELINKAAQYLFASSRAS
jgi:hypothetical protein